MIKNLRNYDQTFQKWWSNTSKMITKNLKHYDQTHQKWWSNTLKLMIENHKNEHKPEAWKTPLRRPQNSQKVLVLFDKSIRRLIRWWSKDRENGNWWWDFMISVDPKFKELARPLIQFEKRMISQHTKNYDPQRAEIERMQ